MVNMNDSFFKKITGWSEQNFGYESNKNKLISNAEFRSVTDDSAPYWQEHCELTFEINKNISKSYDCGTFSTPSVAELRLHVANILSKKQEFDFEESLTVSITNVAGESQSMHSQPENLFAVFQAASQFNYLEFATPTLTPERGISGYEYDGTQGPACAIACAAGTIYRNYLVPTPPYLTNSNTIQNRGQISEKQYNGLQDIEHQLQHDNGIVPWIVKNGYVDSNPNVNPQKVKEIFTKDPNYAIETLIPLLRIGVTRDSQVMNAAAGCFPDGEIHPIVKEQSNGVQKVTQTWNSAISVAYSRQSEIFWEPIARFILKGTYEATLLVGILNTLKYKEMHNKLVPIFLTKVGGGVFGNKKEWIKDAILYATEKVSKDFDIPLDIRIVHYGCIDPSYLDLERKF